jgi:GNAT superfamily N-acetyltransferase
MQDINYNIIDWDDAFEEQALALEKANIQGKNIRLEIIKQRFLDRAQVFSDYYSCLAISGKKLVGSAAAAATSLLINDTPVSTGFGFDMKVHPGYRNHGIGKDLTRKLYSEFFLKKGLSKNMMTAKKVNAPVYKMVSDTLNNTSMYSFVYLVLPSSIKTNTRKIENKELPFSVMLFEEDKLSPGLFTKFDSGLGCFYTHRMYTLKINHIDWKLKTAIKFLKLINPSKYASLPLGNETIFAATLYNYSPGNLDGIDEVLRHIQAKGISQLHVCCKRDDQVFRSLKKYAISMYDYTITADFTIKPEDRIGIDVRCL